MPKHVFFYANTMSKKNMVKAIIFQMKNRKFA